MLFQPVRLSLYRKLFIFVLLSISLASINSGSIQSFAQSSGASSPTENPILTEAKREKRRPDFRKSARENLLTGDFDSVFQISRATSLLENLLPGDLDATFDGDGKVTTPVGTGASEAFDAALQSDGKFVAAGYSSNGVNRDFALVRYDVNGALDASFGTGGKVTTDIGGSNNEALAVAIQPADGKIIAAGYSSNGADDDFTLARYNTDGTLDGTFGTGGIVKTNFNNSFDYSEAVVIQADGKIVAAGYSFDGTFFSFALARYNSNGTLDETFDGDGKATTDFSDVDDLALAVTLQADGKIIAAGVADTDLALARYNSDGSLDTSFDGDGKVTTSINAFDLAYDVAVQADGKIVLAGETGSGGNSDFALARYNSDGSLDITFDGDGKVSTPIGSGNDAAEALTLQTDGKIIAAGYSFNGANADFALARYSSNGALDATFGTGGKVTTDFGGAANDFASALVLQSANRAIAVGSSNLNFAAAAYSIATPNCSYSLSPTSANLPTVGGAGSFNVTAGAGCNWTATSNDSWITVTAGNSGSGNGSVSFSVEPNTGIARTGTIVVAGQIFTINQAGGCTFGINPTSQNFTASGGTGSVALTASNANCTWTATSNADWISVTSGGSGSGNGTVNFSVAVNTGPARSGTVTVAGLTFTVNQSGGCTFSLTETGTNVGAGGGSGVFGVNASNAGCAWTATTNDSWIIINSGSGTGNGAVSYTVQPNVGPARTGTINVNGQTFTINQASGCAYTLSSNSANIPNSGGTGNFNVTAGAGCAWTAVSNDSWITITGGASGSGNGTVSYSVAANTGPARTGTITAGGQTFTVNQANGCSYSLSATSINVPPAGGNASVNVIAGAGCAWTAVSNVDWITITGGASGNGNGTVSFTVAPNTGADRSGTLTIAGQTFTVNQGLGCSYSISPSSAGFNAAGGAGNFNVTSGAGCNWTATTNDSWIIINTGGSGTGNGAVTFTVQANTGPARSGTITVNGQNFTVNQASGCSYSLSANSANIPAGGGTGSFNVNSAAGCLWTASSSVPWITITSGGSGSGSGTVAFTVQPNTGVARTGAITAGGQTFTVNQANGCAYSLSPTSQNFPASGGTGLFAVNASDAGCAWTAASNDSWITITSGSNGSGTGMVGFSVQANTGAARTGTITAAGQIFTVNQASGIVSVRRSFDYDGDGKADLSVFRPSAGSWYISNSSNNAFIAVQFGAAGDLIAPADFDGDGKTDISVFRPSDGGWYRLNSSNDTFSALQFGTNGDLPVPGDFDGDLRADITVYRPSAGSWYRINSSNQQFVAAQFGVAEDKPLVGDFDGDGKSDLTVFRPSNGTWYRINSATDTFSPAQFGATGDLPVAADYDGDGKTDLAVYRPSVGDWYIINSGNSSFTGLHFGVTEDKPAPADFDGDGKADLVVFRPSSGTWYLLRTTAGFTGFQFGASGDVPTPNAFVR